MSKELMIRPSTVGSWLLCPGRPGYRGTEGYNYYPGEALLFGSVMHLVIENRLIDVDLSMDELLDQMRVIFQKDLPDDLENPLSLAKLTTKQQREAMAKEARRAADEWETEVKPTLPTSEIQIETTMRALAGSDSGYDVYVQGTADAIWLEDQLIVDWKSAGRMWKPEKVEGQIQPIAYPWLVKESFDVDIKKFTFWVYDRSSVMWAPFTQIVNKDPHRTGAFRLTAVNAAVALEKGLWTWSPHGQGWKTRGWHCSPKYCDAWSVCWGKHLIMDGQADVKAPRLKEKFE